MQNSGLEMVAGLTHPLSRADHFSKILLDLSNL